MIVKLVDLIIKYSVWPGLFCGYLGLFSSYYPNIKGYLFSVFFSFIMGVAYYFEIFHREDQITPSFKKLPTKISKVITFIIYLTMFFFCGLFGLGIIENNVLGRNALETQMVLLVGETGRKSYACETTAYLYEVDREDRRRVCLSSIQYERMRSNSSQLFLPKITQVVYRESYLGSSYISIKN